MRVDRRGIASVDAYSAGSSLILVQFKHRLFAELDMIEHVTLAN